MSTVFPSCLISLNVNWDTYQTAHVKFSLAFRFTIRSSPEISTHRLALLNASRVIDRCRRHPLVSIWFHCNHADWWWSGCCLCTITNGYLTLSKTRKAVHIPLSESRCVPKPISNTYRPPNPVASHHPKPQNYKTAGTIQMSIFPQSSMDSIVKLSDRNQRIKLYVRSCQYRTQAAFIVLYHIPMQLSTLHLDTPSAKETIDTLC